MQPPFARWCKCCEGGSAAWGFMLEYLLQESPGDLEP